MKNLVYLFLLVSTSLNNLQTPCILQEGHYKVLYDPQFSNYPKFEFEIKNQVVTEINGNPNQNFIIENLGENTFRFKPLSKPSGTPTEFQKKIITDGIPYYEITSCTKDTLSFVKRVNLHVISHSGKFVKLK